MAWSGMCGKSNPSGWILQELRSSPSFFWLPYFHIGSGMRDTCSGSEKDRQLQLLREFKGVDGHISCLLWVCRVQTGDTGKLGIASRVLLVL